MTDPLPIAHLFPLCNLNAGALETLENHHGN